MRRAGLVQTCPQKLMAISLQFGQKRKAFSIYPHPHPHIVVDSSKELHGWQVVNRECTAERLLINPYIGCSHACPFCYSLSLPGPYFDLFHRQKIAAVFKDFDQVIARQLDSLKIASCGYLSPVTDPFQPLNRRYNLSEKIVRVFVERNLPIEIITKGIIPDEVIELLASQKHSFAQVSVLTLNESLHRFLVPGGVPVRKLLENFKRLDAAGVFSVCRVDPVIPLITDDKEALRRLIQEAVSRGAKHIVGSSLDIPFQLWEEVIGTFSRVSPLVKTRYPRIFTERMGTRLHARLEYRQGIFDWLRAVSDEEGVGFALCMEFERKNGRWEGLNQHYATTLNCEGLDVPLYVRRGRSFEPWDCQGACLVCSHPTCPAPQLAGSQYWKLSDYRRWSRSLLNCRLRP